MPDPEVNAVMPDFPPVPAADPVVTPPIPEETQDVWGLDYQHIRRYEVEGGFKFELYTIWSLGRMSATGVWTPAKPENKKNVVLADMLSPTSLDENPEIGAIATPFFTNLASLCKRVGNL
jgi:hypothetical protein